MECSGDSGLRLDRSIQTKKTWDFLSFLRSYLKVHKGKSLRVGGDWLEQPLVESHAGTCVSLSCYLGPELGAGSSSQFKIPADCLITKRMPRKDYHEVVYGNSQQWFFQSGNTILYYTSNAWKSLIFPHSCQHLLVCLIFSFSDVCNGISLWFKFLFPDDK